MRVPVYAIEGNQKFFDATSRLLERLKVKNVTLCYAPLNDEGGYSWPDLPDDFGAALIDGPMTGKGRASAIRYLAHALKSATVLLDDVELLDHGHMKTVEKSLPQKMTIVNGNPDFAVFTKGKLKNEKMSKDNRNES